MKRYMLLAMSVTANANFPLCDITARFSRARALQKQSSTHTRSFVYKPASMTLIKMSPIARSVLSYNKAQPSTQNSDGAVGYL